MTFAPCYEFKLERVQRVEAILDQKWENDLDIERTSDSDEINRSQ